MIGEDVKGKIWEVQAMCQNDSTYRGTAERQDFYFKSPLAKLEENEDEYSRCWVYLSDNFKNKLRSFLEHLNDDQGFKLPQEDELTSYDNPEYLWLAYELEHIRHAYNSAMVNPYTGELLAGCKKIPYVQLPYQLRAYRMLSVALSRLQNLGIWCEDGQVCSADGEKIKKEFFEEVKKLAFQMINSFETSLSMFFAKTENIYELAQSERLQELYEMVIKEQDELIPEISKEKIPWLLGYTPEGQAEMKRVHDLWKDVREHLEKNGTYCRLRKFEEWVPLG